MDEREFLLKLKKILDKAISLINEKLSIPNEEKKVKKVNRFSKPTLEEVTAYCEERNNNIEPEKFFDYYESIDWYRGKNKIKNWKAVVRTWENKNKNEYNTKTFARKENVWENKPILKNELIKFRGKLCECKGKYVKFENKVYDSSTGYEITDISWDKL